ncbi:MAG: hypothetical protein M3N28_06305 [Actinomycetota bacterium]|nr:hypothetical protein [Actinomycetota bacterium]
MAAAVAGLVDVGYLWLIRQQGTEPLTDGRVLLVATLVAMSAVAAAVGGITSRPLARLGLLALASSLLMVLGVVGLFSIGLPLLAASGLALGGAVAASQSVEARPGLLIVLVAFDLPLAAGIVFLGLVLT